MIGKQYLNPTFLQTLKHQAQIFVDKNLQPHLSDVNGSLLGIEQHLEEISRSLREIAGSIEKQAEHDRAQTLRNEGVEPW